MQKQKEAEKERKRLQAIKGKEILTKEIRMVRSLADQK